jgi:hypothetical protein
MVASRPKARGVGSKSAGPFVGNVIPDEDHLGRIGRRLQTVIIGSQLRGRRKAPRRRATCKIFHGGSWGSLGGAIYIARGAMAGNLSFDKGETEHRHPCSWTKQMASRWSDRAGWIPVRRPARSGSSWGVAGTFVLGCEHRRSFKLLIVPVCMPVVPDPPRRLSQQPWLPIGFGRETVRALANLARPRIDRRDRVGTERLVGPQHLHGRRGATATPRSLSGRVR